MRGSRLAANPLSVESRRIWLSVARSSARIIAISLFDTDESAPDAPSRLEAPVAVLRPLAGTEDLDAAVATSRSVLHVQTWTPTLSSEEGRERGFGRLHRLAQGSAAGLGAFACPLPAGRLHWYRCATRLHLQRDSMPT